ncbi:hypothetical protein [Winogradskyella sp. Asnod2-B02-A]|uniref:hypothetical protein n=1 Tax=Winogradskyella sp. Asnod2-B02-A TaxID=3160583 RepID=UPI003870D258
MKALRILLVVIAFTFANTVLAQTVYTTKTGEKYHKSACRYLKYSKKEYTLDKAKALGFSACSVCKPNKGNTSAATQPNTIVPKSENTTPSKKAVASQCTGKTQSGARCKRKTKNVNGRCHQH